jgi:hypothetical protein
MGNDCGAVYQLSPPAQTGGSWTETLIYEFQGKGANDGEMPSGGPIIDAAGNLYGVTAYGGTGNCVLLGVSAGCGTVYELSPPTQKGGAWTETILYSFPTAKQGYFPWGDLVFDKAGNLYGATSFGGTKGTTCDPYYGGQCGVVFELSPPKEKGGAWTQKVLHNFAGGTDGAEPSGGLVLDGMGAIYGTTWLGGNQPCRYGIGNCGTLFGLLPPITKGGSWKKKTLHGFTGGTDGNGPNGGLVFDARGSLYGTAGAGGTGQGMGLVFRLSRTKSGWTETPLYSFQGGSDGSDPVGPVKFDTAGNIYGTASSGGTNFAGTLFRLKPPRRHESQWGFGLLYSFRKAPDGAYPAAGLIFDKAGNLYSTTQYGGTGQACQGGCGTVFNVWQ